MFNIFKKKAKMTEKMAEKIDVDKELKVYKEAVWKQLAERSISFNNDEKKEEEYIKMLCRRIDDVAHYGSNILPKNYFNIRCEPWRAESDGE